MRRRKVWAGILAVVVAAGCARDAQDGGDQRALAESADSAVPGVERAVPRGLDSVLLAQAFDSAARLPRMRSLLVARHGELVREQYFHGATAEGRANIKSASKSILSALVGIAIAEGHLEGVDQPIAPLFASYAAANADPRIYRVTVGNLLSMQAGLEPTSFGNYGGWVTSSNWVRNALTRRFVDDPGGRMLYSTGSTHVLSAALTRATGMSTLAYARSRLFEPLGIELRGWATDPQGVYFGGNEMRLRPRELLAFAELYRNGGVHEDRQIVPSDWIATSWRPRTTSPFNGHGYGLGWWLRERRGYAVYFAWGYGGQYAFIVPELELTVVTTSDAVSAREGGHNRALHALLTDLIIPAATR
jgi:CubicO group peptidase (beta-lactamase class C family)